MPVNTAAKHQGENPGWGSLDDVFAPRKLAAPAAARGGGGGEGPGPSKQAASSNDDNGKSPSEICTWLRSLPQSHVPEKAQEALCNVVEGGGMSSKEFSDYVQKVPPEVCAPKNAMKLKAAWNNVLAEGAAREVAKANLANNTKKKATMMVI